MQNWKAVVAASYLVGLLLIVLLAELLAPVIGDPYRFDWGMGLFMALFFLLNAVFFPLARLYADRHRTWDVD